VPRSHPITYGVRLPSAAEPTRLARDAGGEIALAVDVREDSAVVCVRDCGIAADVLPHIFDLSARRRDSVLRSADRLGVGFALVRMLVDLHGGSVSATSTGPEHGREFTGRLPVLPGSINSLDGADPHEPGDAENGSLASIPSSVECEPANDIRDGHAKRSSVLAC
jgi:Histidine kinase-, DNA gyrase B-, and HSP90-like ATPase